MSQRMRMWSDDWDQQPDRDMQAAEEAYERDERDRQEQEAHEARVAWEQEQEDRFLQAQELDE